MGKKSRRKKEVRQYPPNRRKSRPDDYVRYGPLEIARFGKAIFMRNRMSQEQAEAVQAKLIDHLPDVVKEIDNLVSQIALKISYLPPDELLKRAYWQLAKNHLGIKSEIEVGREGMVSLRMIDYVQSVVASIPPAETILPEVTEQEWLDLRSLVESLFMKLNNEYFPCQAALKRKDPQFSPGHEDFFSKAQMYWCNIRGQRYQVHNIPFLQDVLATHDEVLKELYEIGAQEFVDALLKIQNSQVFGIGELFEDMNSFRADLVAELEKRGVHPNFEPGNDSEPFVKEIIKEKGWSDRRDSIAARFSQMDLHDVERLTNLPKALLEDLSWSQGEDKEFF